MPVSVSVESSQTTTVPFPPPPTRRRVKGFSVEIRGSLASGGRWIPILWGDNSKGRCWIRYRFIHIRDVDRDSNTV